MITLSWPLAITYGLVIFWAGGMLGIFAIALMRAADQENDERVFKAEIDRLNKQQHKDEIAKWLLDGQPVK